MTGEEAVASLSGLFMRRLQENRTMNEQGEPDPVSYDVLLSIWGEALEQFSKKPEWPRADAEEEE